MALKALKSTGDGVNQCRTEINVKTEMRVLDRGCCQTVWRFTCGGFRVSLHYSALLCAALQLLVLMEARCFLTFELPRKRKAAASFNGTFRRNKKKWRDEFSEFRAKASLTFEELDECGCGRCTDVKDRWGKCHDRLAAPAEPEAEPQPLESAAKKAKPAMMPDAAPAAPSTPVPASNLLDRIVPRSSWISSGWPFVKDLFFQTIP